MRVGTSSPALMGIPVNHGYQERFENKDFQSSSGVLLPDRFSEKSIEKKVADNNITVNLSTAIRPQENSSSAPKKIKKVKPPLYRAAEKGNIQKLTSSLEKGADPNQPCNDQPHLWPLLTACIFNNIECVRILLEKGANPNVVDRSGYSPLSYATSGSKNTPDLCRLLLEHGASLDARFTSDMTVAQRFEDFEPNEFTLPNAVAISEIIKSHQIKQSKQI